MPDAPLAHRKQRPGKHSGNWSCTASRDTSITVFNGWAGSIARGLPPHRARSGATHAREHVPLPQCCPGPCDLSGRNTIPRSRVRVRTSTQVGGKGKTPHDTQDARAPKQKLREAEWFRGSGGKGMPHGLKPRLTSDDWSRVLSAPGARFTGGLCH